MCPELEVEPIFEHRLVNVLEQLVRERRGAEELAKVGLRPTATVLFTGPPGVGKSLAARWIARELDLPLLVLDLSAVMSSFLGRTGNNVRHVLDYAKKTKCVLLLDELDAIAKRRDDATEVGELKRLVTVLLQEVDDWPPEGLLIAATNHPGLLDPAVWRRFDLHADFPMPDDEGVGEAVSRFLGESANGLSSWKPVLSVALRGASFSDIERTVMRGRRAAAVSPDGQDSAFEAVVRSLIEGFSRGERTEVAAKLVGAEVVSQRRAHELTGISRDTIRKAVRETRIGQGGGAGP